MATRFQTLFSLRAVLVAAAALLAGCQSLPPTEPTSPPMEPQVAKPVPPKAQAPRRVSPPAAPLAVREQVLSNHIARAYSVEETRATEVVQAAGSASRNTGLPRTLILAVIAVESSFNPMAVSSVGARGLMQVLPEAHPEKVSSIGGEERLHDVQTNVTVGARILAEYHRGCGDMRTALRRYSGAARNYANKVLARKRGFDQVEAAAGSPLRLGALDVDAWWWADAGGIGGLGDALDLADAPEESDAPQTELASQ